MRNTLTRKGSNDLIGTIILLGLVLILGTLVLPGFKRLYEQLITKTKINTLQISVESKIKEAIEVSEIQNKVTEIRSSFVGMGVGTGMGAVQINCTSLEQFLEQASPNEKIYTSLETDGRFWWPKINRVYIQFLENRSGILSYRDEISYEIPENNRASDPWLKSTDKTTAIIQYEVWVKRK